MPPDNTWDIDAVWNKPETPATVTHLPLPAGNGNGVTTYGAAALQRELDTLAATGEGSRNHQLNTSAYNLAQLVASHHLERQTTIQQLRTTASAIGLTASEIDATLRSAFKAGTQTPRVVPDRTPKMDEVAPDTISGDDETPLFKPGGAFILDTDPEPKAIWGIGETVIWADGEALIIAAPQGVGKTTIAQQITLGRCGFPNYLDFLGYPIEPGQKRVLYLAMDRPKQAARSFRRMVGENSRATLDNQLLVWPGPPPHDLAKYPTLLLDLCRKADADTVIVDSIKDAAIPLSDDAVGAGYNRARQHVSTAGIQILELHHLRKALSGAKAEHPTLDDLYGSTWITAGAGSILLLNGAPGDPIITMHHLKTPSSEVGPYKLMHDHGAGTTVIWHQTDLVEVVRAARRISAVDAARAMFEADKPTAAQKEKARRKLDKLVDSGLLWVFDQGDAATKRPRLWAVK